MAAPPPEELRGETGDKQTAGAAPAASSAGREAEVGLRAAGGLAPGDPRAFPALRRPLPSRRGAEGPAGACPRALGSVGGGVSDAVPGAVLPR